MHLFFFLNILYSWLGSKTLIPWLRWKQSKFRSMDKRPRVTVSRVFPIPQNNNLTVPLEAIDNVYIETNHYGILYVFAATLLNRGVPICLEKCNIPEVLRCVYVLPYYKTETKPWFWQRLFKAFSEDSEGKEQRAKTSVHLPDIVLEKAVQKINSQ